MKTPARLNILPNLHTLFLLTILWIVKRASATLMRVKPGSIYLLFVYPLLDGPEVIGLRHMGL